MKKILSIIIFGLLLSGNAYAETYEIKAKKIEIDAANKQIKILL